MDRTKRWSFYQTSTIGVNMPFTEANLFAVVVSYTMQGNRLSTKVNYGLAGTQPNDVCSDLADAFQAAVMSAWQDAVSQDVIFQDIYCYCELADQKIPQRKPFIGTVGLQAFDAVPSNLMAILQLRQIEASSRHNNRLYIGGVSEDDVQDGLITGAAVADHWDGFIAALNTQLTLGGGLTADIVAVKRSESGSPVTPVGNVVGQISLNRSLGTIRRRTTERRDVHA